jgi:hypothetical protein
MEYMIVVITGDLAMITVKVPRLNDSTAVKDEP